MSLRAALEAKAAELWPLDPEYPDFRRYQEDTNPAAIDGERWLDEGSSYIWRVGVLAQIDSNKCDHVRVVIGHEREPGQIQIIGQLSWDGGENDDIGRCLDRARRILADLHPVFEDD